jgi:hypothetical protein
MTFEPRYSEDPANPVRAMNNADNIVIDEYDNVIWFIAKRKKLLWVDSGDLNLIPDEYLQNKLVLDNEKLYIIYHPEYEREAKILYNHYQEKDKKDIFNETLIGRMLGYPEEDIVHFYKNLSYNGKTLEKYPIHAKYADSMGIFANTLR